jgi:prefoldin alpha subunit
MEDTENFDQQLNQYRYLKEQRDMFQGQFEIINASLGNLYTTKRTLDSLENVNENDEILIPIGGLASIKATIKDTKNVLVSVNQDTVIEKTVEDAVEFLSRLIDQHNTQLKFLKERIFALDLNLQGMNQMLQQRMAQQ